MIRGPITPTRCLVVLVAASCLLFFALVPRYDLFEEPQTLHILAPRQGLLGPFPDSTSTTGTGTTAATTSTTAAATTTSATSTTTTSTSSTTTSSSSTTTSSSTTSQSSTTSSTSSTTTSQQSTSTSAQQTTRSQESTSQQSAVTTAVVSTGTDGEVQTVIVTSTPPASSPSTSSAADNTDTTDSGSNKTSTIIGLSVAGGVALIGLVLFLVWKFSRKRVSSEFDDGEAIKWPELNNHSNDAALPVANRGLETGSPSEISRAPSRMNEGYAASVAASSTTELYAPTHDPYAVPPLPHMNPNQPYRDDPAAYGPAGYYDPYRGPIPQTFNDAASEHGGEAIPMTQLAANRVRSPAPGLALDMTGRASPGPMMGRASPGPQLAYGRPSPAPNVGLGLGAAPAGRQSPGPHMAYDMGPR
ncbi:hypothetical protein NEOLEDRAFT_1174837 [Neolentinus lepideus HHB14362 ss-1]|uniref:Mid2 domain-containing protein n=1 Tax=Neolentinus lepideus HHB14362 ss-1 TaxID=1314782 RepID=A0A165VL58_9AGAM|nr:hypothetical protein NEOLEDRAFT_1174837 [Neolentinus lepideus HHB14362 ss-1]